MSETEKMTDQVIPEAAVEAALSEVDRALNGALAGGAADTIVRVILEAAAPRMLAEAKRDAWDEGWQQAHATGDPVMAGIFFNPYRSGE